jgi:hypothetical protein
LADCATQLKHDANHDLQAQRGREAARRGPGELAQVFQQVSPGTFAPDRGCHAHPRNDGGPSGITERLVDETATTKCDAVRGLLEREPNRLKQIVDRFHQLVGDSRCKRLKMVEVDIEGALRDPCFPHDVIDGDRFDRLLPEQRSSRRHQLSPRSCPLLAADFGATDWIDIGHVQQSPRSRVALMSN